MQERYRESLADLNERGCTGIAELFEERVRTESRAVTSVSVEEIARLAKSDRSVFQTYYQKLRSGSELPKGDPWAKFRDVAESVNLRQYKEEIRFAVLSLSREGAYGYGPCSLTLREHMIAHRATLFDSNNVVWAIHQQNPRLNEVLELPPGYRATWPDRGKLCMAKLGGMLTSETDSVDFPAILLPEPEDRAGDIVEVHVFGSVTVRTVEHALIRRRGNRPTKVQIRDLEKLLRRFDVTLEVI